MDSESLVSCPYCGHMNIAGEDRCQNCFHSLAIVDVQEPHKDDVYQQVMMETQVSEIIKGSELLVADAEDSLDRVVNVLEKEHKSCIVVYHDHKLVGILSKRDLLKKAAKPELDLSAIQVKEVMTKDPEYVMGDVPLAFAVNKMALGGFRHVPVLRSDGAPLGMISIQDVLACLAKTDNNTAA